MKPVSEMDRLELAAFVAAEFRRRKINVVLSGGSCVSIYSAEKYVSMDLDFVNAGFARRAVIREAMEFLSFSEENRHFRHPDTEFLVEFSPGPLGVGQEPVKQIDEISTDTGVVRIISATDCVKDRFVWYYHDNDTECLEQAVLVAAGNDVDIDEIARWSAMEGKQETFDSIKDKLTRGARRGHRTARHKTTGRRETMPDLKIRVFKRGAADPATTVTVPGGVLKVASKLIPKQSASALQEKGIDLDEIIELSENPDARGTLVEVEEHEKNERVVIALE